MRINIIYPNEQYNFDFTICAAFHNGKETMLLGQNHAPNHNDQLEVLGFVENDNKDNKAYLYNTKYINKTYCNRLDKAKIGKQVDIFSNISTCFWTADKYVKIELNLILPIIQEYDKFRLISKTPDGFMI